LLLLQGLLRLGIHVIQLAHTRPEALRRRGVVLLLRLLAADHGGAESGLREGLQVRGTTATCTSAPYTADPTACGGCGREGVGVLKAGEAGAETGSTVALSVPLLRLSPLVFFFVVSNAGEVAAVGALRGSGCGAVCAANVRVALLVSAPPLLARTLSPLAGPRGGGAAALDARDGVGVGCCVGRISQRHARRTGRRDGPRTEGRGADGSRWRPRKAPRRRRALGAWLRRHYSDRVFLQRVYSGHGRQHMDDLSLRNCQYIGHLVAQRSDRICSGAARYVDM
jgi:hypothetical protein